jgi:superoxide reductase
MDRRDVLRFAAITAAGTAASLYVPKRVLAATDVLASPLAGGIFYTADHPGRWAGAESHHVPQMEHSGGSLRVTTNHPMNGYTHYIVKHQLLDGNLEVVREVAFDPTKDKPVSEHDVSDLQGRIYALSMCNVHDVWLNALEL